QSRKPRAFGIPLVPADESSHPSIFRVKGLKAEISGSEVKLFVVKRVVRDMHLAVKTAGTAVGVKNDGGVVIETARATLEDRNHDRGLGFAGDGRERFGRRPR